MSSRPKHFIFIFTFMISLYLIFWHLPLLSLNALKTASQDPNFSDQNYYLYIANDLASRDYVSLNDLNASWSTFGVIGYLYLGKTIFQTEFFYSLLNPVLFLTSWILVIKNLRKNLLIRKDGLLMLALFPSMLLTLSTPGKEFLAIFGTLIFLNGCIYHFAHTRNQLSLFYIILGLLIVGLNRPHESAVLIFSILAFKCMTDDKRMRTLLLSISFLLVIIWSVSETKIFIALMNGLQDFGGIYWDTSAKNISPSLNLVSSSLYSDNLFIHNLLGIPRVIIIFFAPLITSLRALVDPQNVGFGFDYYIFRDLSSILRMLDTIASISIIIFSIRNFNKKKLSPHAVSLIRFFVFYTFISYYSIAYFGIVEKSRYFIQSGFVWLLIFLLIDNSRERLNQDLN